jgi:N-acetylneuraminic acid mutarotase
MTKSLLALHSAVGAAALNNKLYVCGGYDGVCSLNTVECYDPRRNVWNMATSMSKHRSAAGVVTFQQNVYALGGHDGVAIFDSVRAKLNSRDLL